LTTKNLKNSHTKDMNNMILKKQSHLSYDITYISE